MRSKKLARELTRLNQGVKFEVSDYNPYTFEPWIDVRGAVVPLNTSLILPLKAKWHDKNHIEYKGKKILLIPLP